MPGDDQLPLEQTPVMVPKEGGITSDYQLNLGGPSALAEQAASVEHLCFGLKVHKEHQLADIGTRIQGLQQSLDSDLAMLGKNPENLPPDEPANAQAKLCDKVNEQVQQLLHGAFT